VEAEWGDSVQVEGMVHNEIFLDVRGMTNELDNGILWLDRKF
jgi:hypothetical protein